ncbi:hypothetical protein D3C84_892610 [compost metagenome]
MLQAAAQIQQLRAGPLGHVQREGQQNHGIAEHGRVERVLADAAIQLLAKADGTDRGDNRYPPGGVGRQGSGKQGGADQGAAIIE